MVQNKAMEKLAYTIQEAAASLGISRSKVHELIADQSSGFPSVKIGGRRVVPVDRLRAWLEAQSGAEGVAR